MISKKYFRIIEKYVFLGTNRYRVQIIGTNIVFNVKALTEEEALEKALKLAEKIGLTNEHIEKLQSRIKNIDK